MSRLPIRVVKVGGSLFDLTDLPERLHLWLASQTPAHQILIAGGGLLVEQVRQLHKVRSIDEVVAHWICVDLMSVAAQLLHEWLKDIPLIDDDCVLCQRLGEQSCTIFDPANWLRHSEPNLHGKKLPASWDVTSDAIAARLAIVLQADELIFCKSTVPASHSNVAGLARNGLIDRWLPNIAHELPTIRIVNLRDLPHRSMIV